MKFLRRIWSRTSSFELFVYAIALIVILLVVYPLIAMFIRVLFTDGVWQGEAFDTVFSSSAFWRATRNSAAILAVGGGMALVAGSAFAWLNERTTARIPFLSRILPVVPLLMPGVALSVGWVFLGQRTSGYLNAFIRDLAGVVGIDLGTTGPINIATLFGVAYVYALYLIPFPYLVVSSALQNLDPALEEASRTSGAGLRRTVTMVSMPSIRAALMSSTLLIVIVGSAVYSVPVIIGTTARVEVLSVYTVNLIRSTFPPRLSEAAVISLFLVIVIGSVWFINRQIQRRQRHATIGGRSGTALVDLGSWRPVARGAMVSYLIATAILPIMGILLAALQRYWTPNIVFETLSLRNFANLFSSSLFIRALTTSFGLAVVGATISMILAAVLAAFVRERKGITSVTVDGIAKLPGAITNIVIGIAFLVVLGGSPFHLHGTTLILLLAYLVIYMPQASIAAGSAADQVGRELTEASWMGGSSRGRTFRKITLPLMRPGLAAGWTLVFVVMIGDLTASAILAGTRNPVVGFVILDIWEAGTYSDLAALAVIVTGVSIVAVVTVLWYGRSGVRSDIGASK